MQEGESISEMKILVSPFLNMTTVFIGILNYSFLNLVYVVVQVTHLQKEAR